MSEYSKLNREARLRLKDSNTPIQYTEFGRVTRYCDLLETYLKEHISRGNDHVHVALIGIGEHFGASLIPWAFYNQIRSQISNFNFSIVEVDPNAQDLLSTSIKGPHALGSMSGWEKICSPDLGNVTETNGREYFVPQRPLYELEGVSLFNGDACDFIGKAEMPIHYIDTHNVYYEWHPTSFINFFRNAAIRLSTFGSISMHDDDIPLGAQLYSIAKEGYILSPKKDVRFFTDSYDVMVSKLHESQLAVNLSQQEYERLLQNNFEKIVKGIHILNEKQLSQLPLELQKLAWLDFDGIYHEMSDGNSYFQLLHASLPMQQQILLLLKS